MTPKDVIQIDGDYYVRLHALKDDVEYSYNNPQTLSGNLRAILGLLEWIQALEEWADMNILIKRVDL